MSYDLNSQIGLINNTTTQSVQVQNLTINGTTNTSVQGIYPVGTIIIYSSTSGLPAGWLLCDGQEYTISLYPSLFAIIGTTFGSSGDGFFKVPNFTNLLPIGRMNVVGTTGGQNTITLTQANLPSHFHSVNNTSITSSHSHAINWSVIGTGTELIENFNTTTNTSTSGVANRTRRTGEDSANFKTLIQASNVADIAQTNNTTTFSGNTSSQGNSVPIDISNPYLNIYYIIKY